MKIIRRPQGCKPEQEHMYQSGYLKPAFCETPEQAGIQHDVIFSVFTRWLELDRDLKEKYGECSKKETSQECFEVVKNFRQNPQSFVLFGNPGTGKTYCSLLTLKTALEERFYNISEVRFVTMYKVDKQSKHLFQDDLRIAALTFFDAIAEVPFLVLDDVGAESKNETNTARLTDLLDERFNRKLVTIMSTNLTYGGAMQRYNERLLSRMPPEERWYWITGKDRRKDNFA